MVKYPQARIGYYQQNKLATTSTQESSSYPLNNRDPDEAESTISSLRTVTTNICDLVNDFETNLDTEEEDMTAPAEYALLAEIQECPKTTKLEALLSAGEDYVIIIMESGTHDEQAAFSYTNFNAPHECEDHSWDMISIEETLSFLP